MIPINTKDITFNNNLIEEKRKLEEELLKFIQTKIETFAYKHGIVHINLSPIEFTATPNTVNKLKYTSVLSGNPKISWSM